MKKQRKKNNQKSQKQASRSAAQPEAAPQSRRDFLKWARNGAIALPVLGGIGYYSVQSVQATICEADLSKIGQGTPSIVQIHDPQCPLCQDLQRQTRRALKGFDDDELTYLVANVKTEQGSAFAAYHGVPHVTLLLFDGAGEMVQVIRGPNNADVLRDMFDAHLKEYG